MILEFQKYHGNGNDFILVDNRDGRYQLSLDQIRKICHRRFGIGSDGIIFIEKESDVDYHMNFYNPDGSQSFCGNGSRCALDFANKLGIINNEARFLAIDGIHEAQINGDEMRIHMSDVSNVEIAEDHIYLNTGSPHYINFVENIGKINVVSEGQAIRYNERFKEVGTNVNFVQLFEDHIESRVYERGVENETYSSGTGSTAQALASFIRKPDLGRDIAVKTRGGVINISFELTGSDSFTKIWLKGKVEHVFSGRIEL